MFYIFHLGRKPTMFLKILFQICFLLYCLVFLIVQLPGNVPVCKITNDTNSGIKLIYPKLVNNFYELRDNQLFWFLPNENSHSLRQLLKAKLDSSENLGLKKKSIT